MMAAIWWIRRDLRLHDNQALTEALARGGTVVPLFVLDPALWTSDYVGKRRLAFLIEGLGVLDAALQDRGSRLIIRQGSPLGVLSNLLEETGATTITAESDYSSYATRRDAEIASVLPLRLVDGVTVLPPGSVVKTDGTPYTVFTPFSRAWKVQPLPDRSGVLPAPEAIATFRDLQSLPLPAVQAAIPATFPAGEAEARRRLGAFLAGPVQQYGDRRDFMADAGTSALSPYLRFGMLSAREAVVAVREWIAEATGEAAQSSASIWLNELIWREFYIHILAHFPDVQRGAFRQNLRAVPWRNNEAEFDAWCVGRTGYPVVDAAMRQLAQTGWMHNRARMIAASFLTKDLLIDWRRGERWFMQQLIDGDPAANNGGWQWSAGTGTDAAPYFRIFNPVSQGKKFDPDGSYVRRWVPELSRVPARHIHEPWQMSAQEQQAAHCRIGHEYPPPIVDHALARQRALDAYALAKTRSGSV
jgi:deoxyribodipyrimidine photo-lyase